MTSIIDYFANIAQGVVYVITYINKLFALLIDLVASAVLLFVEVPAIFQFGLGVGFFSLLILCILRIVGVVL